MAKLDHESVFISSPEKILSCRLHFFDDDIETTKFVVEWLTCYVR